MDIVDALTERAQSYGALRASAMTPRALDMAADEIERLREEMELWKQSEVTCDAQYAKLAAENETLRERNETLQAEVERLRRQLVMG